MVCRISLVSPRTNRFVAFCPPIVAGSSLKLLLLVVLRRLPVEGRRHWSSADFGRVILGSPMFMRAWRSLILSSTLDSSFSTVFINCPSGSAFTFVQTSCKIPFRLFELSSILAYRLLLDCSSCSQGLHRRPAGVSAAFLPVMSYPFLRARPVASSPSAGPTSLAQILWHVQKSIRSDISSITCENPTSDSNCSVLI